MNPLTWLLAKLNRPTLKSEGTPASRLAPQDYGASPAKEPTVPTEALPAPPTEAERAARYARRNLAFELWLADDFDKAIQEGRDMADELPAELLRLLCMLKHNAADQAEARRLGHWAEELRLATEAGEMEASVSYQTWHEALCTTFGRATGHKLANQQIEPGMTLAMVGAALGEPDEGAMTVPLDDPAACVIHYGKPGAGALIELRHGIVTRATLGPVGFPAFLYQLPDNQAAPA